MITQTKRIISILLTLATLCTVFLWTGCSGKTDTPEQSTAATTVLQGGEDTTPEDTRDPYFTCEIDTNSIDYKGDVISILAVGRAFSVDEFLAENVNGETVNDAVYARNMDVEEKLGVKLNIKLGAANDAHDTGKEIRRIVATGDKTYDFATMPGYTHSPYVLEGDFINLYDVPELNLEKGYWTQGFNEIMSNGVKQYVVSGAFSISMIRTLYITLYNKKLANDRGLPDLYQLAVDGEWTIAKQAEVIKDTYTDLNGSGTADSSDFYGFVSGLYTSADPYWVSFDLPILAIDRQTNLYSLALDTEKFSNIVTTVINLISKNADSYCVGTTSDVDDAYCTQIATMFANEQCIMCTTMVYNLENTLTKSNFSGDYGILPMPKYDVNQQEYRTHVQDQLSVLGIVSTVDDSRLAEVGTVLEYLTAKSYDSVFPAYYETALSYRYLQNAESKNMLDLIYKSIRIEGAFLYSDIFSMLGKFRTIVSGGTSGTGAVKANMNVWKKCCDELNEQLAALTK